MHADLSITVLPSLTFESTRCVHNSGNVKYWATLPARRDVVQHGQLKGPSTALSRCTSISRISISQYSSLRTAQQSTTDWLVHKAWQHVRITSSCACTAWHQIRQPTSLPTQDTAYLTTRSAKHADKLAFLALWHTQLGVLVDVLAQLSL